jgi:hypothetical protein
MTDRDDTLEERWRVVGLVVLLLPLGLILSSCEDPPKPGKPVLQIHGTKPPSIDLALDLSYTATTEQRQCQKFTTRAGYEPITPTRHVWPHNPPSKESGHRDRIVPMDTTGALPDSLQGKDLEPFRWTVNAGWGGEPQGCDFEVVYIGFITTYIGKKNLGNIFYGEIKNIGDFHIKGNKENCPGEDINRGDKGVIEVVCRWGGFGYKSGNKNKLECEMRKTKSLAYCLERPTPDTIDVSMDIRYLNDAPPE